MDYSKIKVIGFDLDQTLYPKSPIIDQAIQSYLYQKISGYRNISLDESAKLFTELYQNGKGLSGRRTLEVLRIPDAANLVQEALEKADIASLLAPDQKINEFLKELKEKYPYIDIISGSHRNGIEKKLSKLKIDLQLFNHVIGGELASKSDLSSFRLWLSYYPNFSSQEFLYIGDRASTDYLAPKELGIGAILVNVKKPDTGTNCLQIDSLTELSNYLL